LKNKAHINSNPTLLEVSSVRKFGDMMISQLANNAHKGSILDFKNFEGIITELEYHKAKLFLAIRVKNKGAIREYLADTANFLLAIGNLFDVIENTGGGECWEINKDVEIFIQKSVYEQSVGQSIF